MAFTQFTNDMDIIVKLSDSPNVDDGLTAYQLKAKFDEGGKALKDYINNTLLTEAQERPTFTGMAKSNGSGIVQAEAGTDYQAPLGEGSVTKTMLASDVTASALGGAVVKTFTATVATGWSGSAAPYTKAVTISGLLASDNPIVDLVTSSTYSTAEAQIEAWGYVYGAVTSADTLTFYATDKPTVALPIQVKVVR